MLFDLIFLQTTEYVEFKLLEGENSTLISLVCATGVLNLSPYSGVGKPKKDTLLWSYRSFLVLYCIVLYCIVLYCIVLYCIVLYCTVLETKIMYMLYLLYQMIVPFLFSSVMFVQNSFKFSITVISLSYDICSAFQD